MVLLFPLREGAGLEKAWYRDSRQRDLYGVPGRSLGFRRREEKDLSLMAYSRKSESGKAYDLRLISIGLLGRQGLFLYREVRKTVSHGY